MLTDFVSPCFQSPRAKSWALPGEAQDEQSLGTQNAKSHIDVLELMKWMKFLFFLKKKGNPWFRELLVHGTPYFACICTFCEGKGLDDLANSVLALAKKFGSSTLSWGRKRGYMKSYTVEHICTAVRMELRVNLSYSMIPNGMRVKVNEGGNDPAWNICILYKNVKMYVYVCL